MFDKTLVGKPLSVIQLHCRTIITTITVTTEQVEQLEASTRQQGKTGISKKLWKKHRHFRITASIAGQVFGTSLDNVSRSLLAKICTEKDSDLSKVPAIQ